MHALPAVSLCTMCMPDVLQKGSSDPLKLELQTIVNCHACVGNEHCSSGRATNALTYLAMSVAPGLKKM